MVVLHYTAMGATRDAIDWLCDPRAEVSAHYVISRKGRVVALVAEDMRAWHAGAGRWGDVEDVNSRSIGIELSNSGAEPFPEPQMRALEELLRDILARWSIPPARVIGHADMAPGRKIDPGPRFDWRRLALSGLSVWPDPHPADKPDPDRADALLRAIGYTADAPLETRLGAFRLRRRPGASGPLDARDMALLAGWAAAHPVDRDAADT